LGDKRIIYSDGECIVFEGVLEKNRPAINNNQRKLLLYQKVVNVIDTSLFANRKIFFRLHEPKSILPVFLKFPQ